MSKDYCKHVFLNFGSGDYYIFCKDCGRSWVQRGEVGDEADSSNLTKAPMSSYKFWVPEYTIDMAVAFERERCAKIAEVEYNGLPYYIANAIRGSK